MTVKCLFTVFYFKNFISWNSSQKKLFFFTPSGLFSGL
jgi:hypothetical protein